MIVKTSIESVGKEELYKALGMTATGAAEDVQAIISWLLKQPHLPRLQSDWLSVSVEDWLESYLIHCKNSLERTKEALDLYFSSRVLLPEIYGKRDPSGPHFRQSFKAFHTGLTPNVNSMGERSLVFSHTKPSAEDFDPLYLMMRITMMMDIGLLENIHHLGLHVIVDFTNVCFAQLTRYNLALTKKAIELGVKAVPHRIAGIHLVNPSTLVEGSITILKQVISKKLQDRIIIHRDPAELVKTIGARIVPADFGGEAPTIAQLSNLWEEKTLAYKDWFLTSESIKSDESKRQGKCRIESTDFGYQGSFRKIEVD